MGRYFGIINYTRQHKVSSYWKGSPPSEKEVEIIGNQLEWNLETDQIFSFSYCEGYQWVKNQWNEVGEEAIPTNKKFEWKTYNFNGQKTSNNFDDTYFCN